jgi:hypothetical protein
MSNDLSILAARWVFQQAGEDFPKDAVSASLDFGTGYGGYCGTCSYTYQYAEAQVIDKHGNHHTAKYDTGWDIELSDILDGMSEIRDNDGIA